MKAMRLFWVHGYKATSIQDLVDGMGIGRGSLYGTFGGKRSLFMRALRYYDQERADLFKKLSTSKPAAPGGTEPLRVRRGRGAGPGFTGWLFSGQHRPRVVGPRRRDRNHGSGRIHRRGGLLPNHDRTGAGFQGDLEQRRRGFHGPYPPYLVARHVRARAEPSRAGVVAVHRQAGGRVGARAGVADAALLQHSLKFRRRSRVGPRRQPFQDCLVSRTASLASSSGRSSKEV